MADYYDSIDVFGAGRFRGAVSLDRGSVLADFDPGSGNYTAGQLFRSGNRLSLASSSTAASPLAFLTDITGGYTYKGTWSALASYSNNDLVTYAGNLYRATAAITPMTQVSDTFSRPNSTSTVNPCSDGWSWTVVSGVFGITGNRGYWVSGTGTMSQFALNPVVRDVGGTDFDMSINYSRLDSNGWSALICNYIDRQNSYFVITDGTATQGRFRLIKIVANTETVVAGATYTPPTAIPNVTLTLRVTRVGNTLTGYINGNQAWTFTDTTPVNGTKVGFADASTSTARWSNFTSTAVTQFASQPWQAWTSLPGPVQYAMRNDANSNGSTGAAVSVMSKTFNVLNGRSYMIDVYGKLRSDSGSSNRGTLQLHNDADGSLIAQGPTVDMTVLSIPYAVLNRYLFTATASTTLTYSMRVLRAAGSGSVFVNIGPNQPATLTIQELDAVIA